MLNKFIFGFTQFKANLIAWEFLLVCECSKVEFWNYLFFGYLVIGGKDD